MTGVVTTFMVGDVDIKLKTENRIHLCFEDKFPEVLNSMKSELWGVPERRLLIC